VVVVLGATNVAVVAFTVVAGRIAGIAAVADPARLASMDLPEPPETGRASR
jgi:hypothetical protein